MPKGSERDVAWTQESFSESNHAAAVSRLLARHSDYIQQEESFFSRCPCMDHFSAVLIKWYHLISSQRAFTLIPHTISRTAEKKLMFRIRIRYSYLLSRYITSFAEACSIAMRFPRYIALTHSAAKCFSDLYITMLMTTRYLVLSNGFNSFLILPSS